MTGLGSYTIADFVPFSAEVYFRLIERVSDTWWPLHLLTLTMGLVATALAWRGRTPGAGSLMAVALVWVGATFLMRDYAQLNWAGTWFGGAFLVGAALLLLFSLNPPPRATAQQRPCVTRLAGLALAALGVVGYPMITPIAGGGWSGAEVFGIHPDPTAIAALGVTLLILRGYRLWLVAAVPALWCVISTLTLQVLGAAWADLPALATGAALIGMALASQDSLARLGCLKK